MTDLRNEAVVWMSQMLTDNPHLTATALAEGVATALDHDSWLDDESHWIWDLAVDMVTAGCS